MVAIIFTFPSHSQNLPISQKYQGLNLKTEHYDNPYNLPDVEVWIDSKHGVSSEPATENEPPRIRTTFKYGWDISNIPEEDFPITINWGNNRGQDDPAHFFPMNLTYDNPSISHTVIKDYPQSYYSIIFTIEEKIDLFEIEFNLRSLFVPNDYIAPYCEKNKYNNFFHVLNSSIEEIGHAESEVSNYNIYFENEWLPPLHKWNDFSTFVLDYYNSEQQLCLSPNYLSKDFSLFYEPKNQSQNDFTFDINHTFEDFKFYLGENASLIIDADITLEDSKIFGWQKMWDKIVVKPGATLTLINCMIEDGVQGIVVEGGGKLISHGSKYFSNYRSITVRNGYLQPPKVIETDLTDFTNNDFYSTMLGDPAYELNSYFYDLPSSLNIEAVQPERTGRSHCGIFTSGANCEIGVYNDEVEYFNAFSGMANGIISNNSNIKIGGVIINGVQPNSSITENYDIKGNGVYAYRSLMYFHGWLSSQNENDLDIYTIRNYTKGINLRDSYNNIILNAKIYDCETGIEIEHVTKELITLPEYQGYLRLQDFVFQNTIEECKYGVNIFPWGNAYFNIGRTSTIMSNIIRSDLPGASGITSTSFKNRIHHNEITLSNNNSVLGIGDVGVQVIPKGSYIPYIFTPESLPTYKFVDGGSVIRSNDINISEVKNGITSTGGRFSGIVRNTIHMTDDADEVTTRKSAIFSGGSRAHIAKNELFYDGGVFDDDEIPALPYLESGINIQNSLNSLVSCNYINTTFTEADFMVMGDNAGSDIRGNTFLGIGKYNVDQIQYGTVNEPFAVTGKQIHRGNRFEYDPSIQSAIHFGSDDEVEKSRFIVGSSIYEIPGEVSPQDFFTEQEGSTPYVCETNERVVDYPVWHEDMVGKDHLQDSLFLERLKIGSSNANMDYDSKDYFDLEYGMDLYENDSIINTPAFSSFKNDFLGNNYDQLFDLRQGLTFKTENPLEFDQQITYADIEDYWASVDSTHIGVVTSHLSSFENTLDDFNPGSTQYLLKNEKDIHTVLHTLIDSTESISNYATLLYDIATECPYQGGKTVYFAQFLYNKYFSPVDFNAMELCATSNLRFKIENESLQEQFLLSPNPVEDFLHITCKSCQYKIYSSDGRIMIKSQTENGYIDVSTLKNGAYFIEITNKNLEKQISKFIKL